MRSLRYLIPVFCLLITAPARADFDTGMAAYERGDFTTAMTEWLPLAKSGDAEAQYRVGGLYGRGEGVEQDRAIAFEWYSKAASQQHPVATYNLGAYYTHGHGVDQDHVVAFKYFLDAAEAGYLNAVTAVGHSYLQGEGVPQNDQKAFHWFQVAAQQGDMEAQIEMASCYMFGVGVEEDPVKGYMWQTLAFRRGDWRHYPLLAIDWLLTTAEQRETARRMADAWQPVIMDDVN